MPALTTILPLTILGSLCTILFTFLARCWRQASRQREGLELGNPDYEVEEIPGTTDFVMVGMRGHRKKKVKKPKLWDISVLNLGGRRAHGRKLSSGSSFSDLSSTKDIGHWAELKPMSVAYVKNPNKAQIPPVPPSPTHPWVGPIPEPSTITMDGNVLMGGLLNSSRSSLSQPPSRDIPPRPMPGPPPAESLAAELTSRTSKRRKHESMGGYDKSTIEAVQVSVLIAMPQRPTFTSRNIESAGPLELGVVQIPLDNPAPRWTPRHSIRPPPP